MKSLEETREYNRKWSKNNRERRQELNKAWRKEQGIRFQKYKSTLLCCLCSESEPCCLQFHHRNPEEKDCDIANAARRWSWDRLIKEIEKCVVVCANCHEKIHAGIAQLAEQ